MSYFILGGQGRLHSKEVFEKRPEGNEIRGQSSPRDKNVVGIFPQTAKRPVQLEHSERWGE